STTAPCALLQSPPQHSASVAQTSPVCTQNDPPAQRPLLQNFEQHSPSVAQALPPVRQAKLSGVHVLPVPQVPLQHCAELEHAWLSLVHCVAPHWPPLQTNVQHSWGIAQAVPAALHMLVTWEQIFAPGSQLPVQQSVSTEQVSPTNLHELPDPPVP